MPSIFVTKNPKIDFCLSFIDHIFIIAQNKHSWKQKIHLIMPFQAMLASVDKQARFLTNFVMDQKCHNLIFKFQEFDRFYTNGCFNQIISKGLGYAIVAGSMMVKVPQILNMVKASSSEGISSTSNLLDLIMVGATLGYGFILNLPFASYGDALFVYVQTAIILILIPFYKNNKFLTAIFLALASVAGYAISNKLIPVNMITIAQQSTIPLTVISRGIQIVTNFSNRSTGQLSGVTAFLSFAGCGSRVFTSLFDAKDNLMALSFGIATVLNGVIFGQILYYSRSIKSKKE